MFAVTMLRRTLLKTQWISLLTLVAGVVLVQLANTGPPKVALGGPEQNRVIGFSAALCACLLSGFAGIYFEKILKGKYCRISLLVCQIFDVFDIFKKF